MAAWVQPDSRSVDGMKVAVTAVPTGTLADYVSGTTGDGDVAVRVRCVRIGTGSTFFSTGDLMKISFTK